MLKELNIENIILIENVKIAFEEGFTVLSGETGAGKSAIIEALKLVFGARADMKVIRHGAESGSVTAVFNLEKLPRAKSFLVENDLSSDDPDLLIIRRTLTSAGKTRATLNHHPVQLSLLKELGNYLLELVGQHDNHRLFHLDEHRQILDLFGSHHLLQNAYNNGWKALQVESAKLKALKSTLPNSFREMESCSFEIQEIEEASFKEGEEEELYEAYKHLAASEERLGHTRDILKILDGERGVLSLLTKAKSPYDLLSKSASCDLSLYPQIVIEVEELLHTLRKYETKQEVDPAKLETMNKRLSFLSKFKRKYGETSQQINAHLSKQKERLKLLQNLEEEIELCSKTYETKKVELQQLADELTLARELSARCLSKQMTHGLHELNMKQAEFQVKISPIPLQLSGQDKVEFFLHTNVGEKVVALKESASGGEIARVLLTLHALLAGKENVGTLIFDEIDANIGGTTASIIGDKLKHLGNALQIISITHFPQVAKQADHHLQISKTVKNERTLSEVAYLDEFLRANELLRMAGSTL